MAEQPGTLEQLAQELGSALYSLEAVLTAGNAALLFAELGLDAPPSLAGDAGFVQKLGDAAQQAAALRPDIDAVISASEGGDLPTIVQAAAKLLVTIGKLITALDAVATDFARATAGSPLAAELAAFAATFVERIIESALVVYLEFERPFLRRILSLLTIVEVEIVSVTLNGVPADVVRRRLFLNRCVDLFTDPLAVLHNSYGWGEDTFDGRKLFGNIRDVFDTLEPTAAAHETDADGPADLDLFSLLVCASNSTPPGLAGSLYVDLAQDLDLTLGRLTDEWRVALQIKGRFGAGLTVTLQPPAKLGIDGDASVAGDVLLALRGEAADPTKAFVLFGESGGSGLEARQIRAGLIAGLKWDAQANKAVADVGFEVRFTQGLLNIETSQSDGFLQTIVPSAGVKAEFDFVLGWRAQRGFYFGGSSALEVRVPAHIELGPIGIEALTIGAKLDAGKIPISVGADIKAALGPIVAVVENMGVTGTFSFPPGNSGNLGPLQFDIGFKPPNGVGLSIDAGVIKGGGFLHLDFDKGEYFGALELSFQNVITLKAIGVINTKMPDGSKGFALLILITAEFTPIQLGFGFVLIGVGGLLALNRSLDTEALRTGVRTGAVNSILFPKDIVANISKIISDLKTIFPIVEAHFVIGPMGKLGWGTPALITLEIGVILDIPQPAFVILGVLRCLLPAEDLAILQLQVNFAGGIDFDKGLIWFDASLFDSHLLVYTLTGDMALRIGWGDQAIFVLTVGGFHPAFKEIPQGLGNMKRLSISLLSGDNPRLSVMTYFAITSNSVQSGARVELYAEACGFNIYGFLGYDLLVQFNPFHFIADIAAGLALREGTDVLFGISVRGQLSGPNPWRARGEASFTILFFDVSIDFDVTWGDEAPAQLEQAVDVTPLVLTALGDDRNWTATLPANTHHTVTLKKIEQPPDRIVLHPFGVLAVSQKVVPLGIELNKFGNRKPGPATRFELTFSGGGTSEVREEFAMANFLRLSDSDKLSRKSFENLRSGLRFSTGDSSEYGANVQKEVNYELSYVHKKKGLTIRGGLFALVASVFTMLSKGGSVTRNAFSVSKYNGGTPPAGLDTADPDYLVVNSIDLSLHADNMLAKTSTEAYQLYDQLLAGDPSLKGKVMVVSRHELN